MKRSTRLVRGLIVAGAVLGLSLGSAPSADAQFAKMFTCEESPALFYCRG